MSTDDSGGRIVLENDRIQVVWPEVAEQPVFARDNGTLAAATKALYGTEIADPLWACTSDRSLVTVHPLGGCVMADDAAKGVVDHLGRVFDPVGGGVHDGLYVCDGSVIPVALDVNPLLTISAIAERTAAKMIEERGWGAAQATGHAAAPPQVEAAPQGQPRVQRAPDRLCLDERARRLRRRLRRRPRGRRPRGPASSRSSTTTSRRCWTTRNARPGLPGRCSRQSCHRSPLTVTRRQLHAP